MVFDEHPSFWVMDELEAGWTTIMHDNEYVSRTPLFASGYKYRLLHNQTNTAPPYSVHSNAVTKPL